MVREPLPLAHQYPHPPHVVMKSSNSFQNTLATIAVTCAVLMTGLVVRREFFPSNYPVSSEPVELSDWSRFLVDGRIIGDASAPVKVIVFSDFQCPYCARFALDTWPRLKDEYGDEIAMVVRYWPLNIHENAFAAAQAAECAHRAGRFSEFHDLLFVKQDSIGAKPFEEYASEAGVADVEQFRACNMDSTSIAIIEQGIAHAEALGLKGTPSVIVNNWLAPNGGLPAVRSLVERALE